MKKLFLLAAALVTSSALLVACGGGGDGLMVAASDTQVEIDASNGRRVAAALEGESFTFANGVPALGTNGDTTVSFSEPSGGSTAPRFTIDAGANTASGTMAFGSCIFRVRASTFPAGHALAVGETVTVNPCNLSVATAGVHANGVATTRSVSLLLGAAASAGASVTISVTPGGQLTLNGRAVGTVTLTPVTG